MNSPHFKKISSITTAGWLILAVLAAAGCASSRGVPGTGGRCDTTQAAPGETVTCTVEGFQDDCTLFVGGIPVAANFDPEEETIEFETPRQPAGPAEIAFACGAEGPKTISDDFEVLSQSTETISLGCADNHDCPGGLICQDGSCVVPTVTTSEDECADHPDCPPNHMCDRGACVRWTPALRLNPLASTTSLLCASDANCANGLVCQNGLCTKPPPPPSDKFSLDVQEMHKTSLGLVMINWSIDTPGIWKQVHLYETRGSDCGSFEEGRYLAVQSNGMDLNPGSGNEKKYAPYLIGERCDPAAGNCPGLDSLPSQSGESAPSFCKIDLTHLNSGRAGEFYTRLTKHLSRYILAVQDASGAFRTDWESIETPEVRLDKIDVRMDEDRPEIVVETSYTKAVSQPVLTGCESAGDTPGNFHAKDGSGHYTARCRLGKKVDLSLKILGIGEGNEKSEAFTISLGAPTLTLKEGTHECDQSNIAYPDCSGTVELRWDIKRSYKIRDSIRNRDVNRGEVPWVQSIEVFDFCPYYDEACPGGDLYSPVEGSHRFLQSLEDVEGSVEVTRNHTHTRWILRGVDLDGTEIRTHSSTDYLDLGYGEKLTIELPVLGTRVAGTSIPDMGDYRLTQYPQCDFTYHTHKCGSDALPVAFSPRKYTWVFSARHCKKVRSTCKNHVVSFNDDGDDEKYKTRIGTVTAFSSLSDQDCELICEEYPAGDAKLEKDLTGKSVSYEIPACPYMWEETCLSKN